MKSNRRVVLGSIVAVALAGAGGAAWWVTRPGPFRAVYNRLTPGMMEADLDRLTAALPLANPEFETGLLLDHTRTVDWEVWDAAGHRRVQVAEDETVGQYQALQYNGISQPPEGLKREAAGRGRAVDRLPATEQVKATVRFWQGRYGLLAVRFGSDGRLTEKFYREYQRRSWWASIREAAERMWPF